MNTNCFIVCSKCGSNDVQIMLEEDGRWEDANTYLTEEPDDEEETAWCSNCDRLTRLCNREDYWGVVVL